MLFPKPSADIGGPVAAGVPGDLARELSQAMTRQILALVTDSAGHVLYVNDELLRLLGLSLAEVAGQPWSDLAIVESQRVDFRRAFAEASQGAVVEADLIDSEGATHRISWASHLSVDTADRAIAVTIVGMATLPDGPRATPPEAAVPGRDPVTGAADRTYFMGKLETSLERAQAEAHPLGVILIDIDRFRAITETLGHDTADVLLREVGGRVQRCAGNRLVARLSGDEFAVLLPRVRTSADAVALAERVIRALRTPFTSLVSPVHLGASAGVALYPHDAEDATTLLRNASIALHRAKEAGGDACSLFQAELGERAHDRMLLEQQLHGAISRREICVYYQPLIDAQTKRVSGVEALARWFHPDLGEIPPARFIPVAEETGMIRALGLHVLRTALSDLRSWLDAGLGPLNVAVNVSARQLQATLLNDVTAILAEVGVAPELLEIEVTESAVFLDSDLASRTLRGLAALGISISLDDFGTGYSCISRLNDLAVSTIKLDRSFLTASPGIPDAHALVHALVSLGRSLHLRIIAEGVETLEQLERLEAEGCDLYQGFYFARPMPAEEIHALLAASSSRI